MRRFLSAGVIFFVLLFDCVLMQPDDFDEIIKEYGEMAELRCSGEYVLFLYKCQCQVSEIEEIILSKRMNDSADTEFLAELTKMKEAGADVMVPNVMNNFGWNIYFKAYEIIAEYPHSTDEINGFYFCSAVVVQGSNISILNITTVIKVNEKLAAQVPVEIIHYAYQILVFLIAFTVFSCMFVLVCVCSEENTTVPEKRRKYYKWKVIKKRKRKMGGYKSHNKVAFQVSNSNDV